MSTQPKTLRLADELADPRATVFFDRRCEAADELRRLHVVNAELLDALKHITAGQYVEGEEQYIARAAIARAEAA